jgi:hypothetical protein
VDNGTVHDGIKKKDWVEHRIMESMTDGLDRSTIVAMVFFLIHFFSHKTEFDKSLIFFRWARSTNRVSSFIVRKTTRAL